MTCCKDSRHESNLISLLYCIKNTLAGVRTDLDLLQVDRLCATLLAPVDFQDKTLVTAAISAPSACEPTNYQRLEFLGDSILKLLTSLSLMAEHLIYDEGRLSRAKDHIGMSFQNSPRRNC